jgi:HNH endonuclease/uncharacterized protein DUF3553
MPFSIGNIVIHNKKPEWGIGIVTTVIDQLKVKVVFNRQQEKTITNANDYLTTITENTCLLCFKECRNGELLSNGWSYHMECYNNVLSITKQISNININNECIYREIQQIENKNNQIELQIQDNKTLIDKCKSLLYSIMIGTFRQISVKQLLDNVKSLENVKQYNVSKIEDLRSKLVNFTDSDLDAHKIIESRLTRLYDYWLSRPPDWEARRDQELYDTVCCNECNKTHKLHVHHIKPISKGGNHTSDNLIVLCENCHSGSHGNRTFEYNDGNSIPLFEKKLKLIKKAIENDYKIEFKYRKYNGDISHRKILPIEIKYSCYSGNNSSAPNILLRTIKDGNYGNLCVKGYCYLRNDERIFAIKNISYLKISEG